MLVDNSPLPVIREIAPGIKAVRAEGRPSRRLRREPSGCGGRDRADRHAVAFRPRYAPHMIRCAACATDNADDARFCNGCGSRLSAAASAPASITEERKVITALFCDLVGFTATSEGADPEDVDRMLTRYFRMARSQIELHGGVVEKFIGDAVVGVFGVPVAHGDDPERAVRAALRIADDAAGLEALQGAPLRLRIGINTGEALVRLDLSPGAGERFLAGDSVNTASRIQSVAPELGVAVGEETWNATSHLFAYAELPPASLKGKAEPVRVFHAIAPRSSLGVDVTRRQASPFVGRGAELALLVRALDRAVSANTLEFATIVGEPGLGKSRLVSQLLAHVDTHPLLVTWRQGRCLPYGSGIAFWALGEIVKSQAGILESDPASVAMAKLDDVLPEGGERAWFRERLLPLLGVESEANAGRDEQFTAWRRFLELLAVQRPTVLVFEDLHWADEAMLAFLEELAVRAAGVPMLVIGTTRPELLERRPDFPNEAERAVRIVLEPLPAAVATDLLGALVDGESIAPRLLRPILERAAGNPLFVEEFIRLLRDRDLLITADGVTDLREDADLPLPDTIHALLAARIDALPAATKAILGDAAVIGKVFWTGAIVAMGERSPDDVRAALDGLVRLELVRRQSRSSMAGEDEFAFWHVLARDVAYAAMPRARRSSRHVAAARWIESKSGDRVEDLAQILAHHYATAFDLAIAAGDDQIAEELRPAALRFLLLAGKRALGLDLPVALGLLERALALVPAGHPDRAMVLAPYGDGLSHDGRFRDAVAVHQEALDLSRSGGDIRAAGAAMVKLSRDYENMGDPRYRYLEREAADLLEPLGPTPELATILQRLATSDAVESRFEEALVGLDRALAIGASSAYPSERDALVFRAKNNGWRGIVRASMGDVTGTDEVEGAIATLTAAGDGKTAMSFRINLAIVIASFAPVPEVMSRLEDALTFGRARGLRADLAWLEVSILQGRYDLSEHDRLLADFARLDAELETQGATAIQLDLRLLTLRVDVLRGRDPGAERLAWIEHAARGTESAESLSGGLGTVSAARLMLGDAAEARRLLAEIVALEDVGTYYWFTLLPTLVRTAISAGDLELAEAIHGRTEPQVPYAEHAVAAGAAMLLEARGDHESAADAYADVVRRFTAVGVIPEIAFGLLGQGRTLLAMGRAEEARPILERARAIFADLRAEPVLREIETMLA